MFFRVYLKKSNQLNNISTEREFYGMHSLKTKWRHRNKVCEQSLQGATWLACRGTPTLVHAALLEQNDVLTEHGDLPLSYLCRRETLMFYVAHAHLKGVLFCAAEFCLIVDNETHGELGEREQIACQS